ncbi:MAG: DUF1330 domain-containing protein [Aestuariivirga sp.]
MPKGYWIAHITVDDIDAYQLYRAKVPDILARHGGRFLIRAGAQTVVEGAARPRTVVIEFPSLAAAQACYNSAEYQAAKALRTNASSGDICIVEGWDG